MLAGDFICPDFRRDVVHVSDAEQPPPRAGVVNNRLRQVVGQFEFFASEKLRDINAFKCL